MSCAVPVTFIRMGKSFVDLGVFQILLVRERSDFLEAVITENSTRKNETAMTAGFIK